MCKSAVWGASRLVQAPSRLSLVWFVLMSLFVLSLMYYHSPLILPQFEIISTPDFVGRKEQSSLHLQCITHQAYNPCPWPGQPLYGQAPGHRTRLVDVQLSGKGPYAGAKLALAVHYAGALRQGKGLPGSILFVYAYGREVSISSLEGGGSLSGPRVRK